MRPATGQSTTVSFSFYTFFIIQGYSKPYRFDRNRNGGGVFIYVREDIPNRELKIHDAPKDSESTFIEINLIKTKWLFCGCYLPPSQSDQYFFENIGKTLDKYSKHYDKPMLIGDFNVENQDHAYRNSFMNTMPRTLPRKTLVLKIH